MNKNNENDGNESSSDTSSQASQEEIMANQETITENTVPK